MDAQSRIIGAFHRPKTKAILNTKLQGSSLPYSSKSIDQLVAGHELIRPEIFSNAPREKQVSYMAYLLLGLHPDQVLVMPTNYEVYQSDRLPGSQRKKADLVKFKSRTIEQHIEDRITPRKAFAEAFSKADLGHDYAGYQWQGLFHTNREYKVVSMVELIQGMLLFVNSNGMLQSKPYVDTQLALEQGGYSVSEVPSVSTGKPYKNIRLDNIPLRQKDSDALPFAVWPNLNSRHECPEQTWSFQYGRGRVGHEKYWCAHEIAAFKKTAQQLAADGNQEYEVVLSPFLTPGKQLFDLYKLLTHNVVKEEHFFRHGKKHLRRRPLNNMEVETCMWHMLIRDSQKSETKGKYVLQKYFSPRNIGFYSSSSS